MPASAAYPLRQDGRMRRLISSESPYEPRVGYSRAVRVGDLVAVSGTAPIGPDGSVVGEGDVYQQTVRCLDVIQAALDEAGVGIDAVVRTRVMLTDIGRWEEAARAHGDRFTDVRPACTFVEVSRFIEPEWLVEVEADAVVSHG
jgi:enamine deaminase RidA (YjgF/YER057c/UK114 family)